MKRTQITTVFLLSALVLIWGVSWPIYKMALNYTPPLLFAGMRTFLGGIGLLLLILPRRKDIRWREAWPVYLISCVFNVIIFFGLQTVGLTYLPSGLFSVLTYLEPVLVGLFAWMWLGESISAGKVVGLVLGFLGVIAASATKLTGHASVIGIVMALITATSWAVGTVYLKKAQGRVDVLWLVAIQFTLGGLFLSISGFATESWADIHWTTGYWIGLLYGAIFGVSLSWIVYFRLVYEGEASRVAATTFVVPLIAVLAGTVFLHEPFTPLLVVGLVLIVASIYLVNRPAQGRGRPFRPRFTGHHPSA